MKKTGKVLTILLVLTLAAVLAFGSSCRRKEVVEDDNEYETEWSYDDQYHWHAAKTGDGVADKAAHVPADDDVGQKIGDSIYYTCTICGFTYAGTAAYVVNVMNIGNAGVSGVDVELYDSNGTLVQTGSSGTDSKGTVRFSNLPLGDYTAKVEKTPDGYTVTEGYETVSLTSDSRTATISLTPHLITDTKLSSSTRYSLGAVMNDFSFTAYKKDSSAASGYTSYESSLDEYLQNYRAVVLNFFYTTCTYCMLEFPAMDQAYNLTQSSAGTNYYDEIGMIELDYTGMDEIGQMTYFVANNANAYDNFTYVYENMGVHDAFNVNAWPTTVVIDRYGVIAYWDDGYQPGVNFWTKLFETYMADDYAPNYSTSTSGSDDDTSSQVKPDVYMEASSVLSSILVSDSSNITFSAYNDEYSWPWSVGEEDKYLNTLNDATTGEHTYGYGRSGNSSTKATSGYGYLYAANSNKLSSYAILVMDVDLTAGQVFAFDYLLSTEEDADYLYIQVDTVLEGKVSGDYITSATDFGWMTFYYEARYSGHYQITLTYQKDSSVNVGDDTVYLSHVRLEESIPEDAKFMTNNYLYYSTDGTTYSTINYYNDLLYNAATPYTDDGTQDNYYPGAGYKNYVDVYLASDGWYHVNLTASAKTDGQDPGDDPYLLADLMYTTPWNGTYSVWNYAYRALYEGLESGVLTESNGYAAKLEGYSWVQNNTEWGYVPVNEDLQKILADVTKSYGADSQQDNDKQWLEVCRYFVHYGAAHGTEGHESESSSFLSEYYDACKAVDNLAETWGYLMAKDVGTISSSTTGDSILSFTATIPEGQVTPRGFYYKVTVSSSGVYMFYSDEEYDSYETDANDTWAWVADMSGNVIADNNNYDFTLYDAYKDGEASEDYALYNDNFRLYAYLEKDTTYLIGVAYSSLDAVGSYDIYIEYKGETYTYMERAAEDAYYTYDEYGYYVPMTFDRNNYMLSGTDSDKDEDRTWYVISKDAEGDTTYSGLYINMYGYTLMNSYGTGYSFSGLTLQELVSYDDILSNDQQIVLNTYLEKVVTDEDSDLYGYVLATKELTDVINEILNIDDDSISADNAWMFCAYYKKTLDHYTVTGANSVETEEE